MIISETILVMHLQDNYTIGRCGWLQFLWNLIDGTLFLALLLFCKTFMKGNTK